MKRNLRGLVVLLAMLSAMPRMYGQMSFDYLGEQWNNYRERSARDVPNALPYRFFRDTVGVREMKDAFLKNEGQCCHSSPYEGFDSVTYIGGYGESVMLVSPLKSHPDKAVRKYRGVWSFFNKLVDLRDENGVSQKQLLKKLNSDYKWVDRDVLKLGHPLWYMGFIVSPRPYWDIYDKGKLLIRAGYSPYGEPDFFTYANCTQYVFDGNWDSRVEGGARLLGDLHGMNSSANMNISEKTFSVLLYEAPKAKNSKKILYTLELLQPEEPDKETVTLFQSFKEFVERIPGGAFKPLYTTDFRIMTGRYYRVTVNKCGWLVEDYLRIDR